MIEIFTSSLIFGKILNVLFVVIKESMFKHGYPGDKTCIPYCTITREVDCKSNLNNGVRQTNIEGVVYKS